MRRAEKKAQTRERILDAAVRGVREMGLEGAGVNAVMKAAGLTHGGFYAHFDSGDDLAVQAMVQATRQQRKRWVSGIEETPSDERVAHLAARYLSPAHRDHADSGCPVPALAAGVAHAGEELRRGFQQELIDTMETLEEILDDEDDLTARHRALGLMALCVGGMVMARAVADRDLSDEILLAARFFAGSVKHRGQQ